MTLREEAEKLVEEEYCRDCNGSGRCCYLIWGTPYDCDGFTNEVENILMEWAKENTAREPE